MSTAIKAPHVLQAICAVASEIGTEGIGKDRQGQGFKFRGIDEVMNALSPLLAKHKLIIVPRILSRDESIRTTNSGGRIYSVVVDAEFDFWSAMDGSKVTARTQGEAMDVSDKATNKAMAVAYKYAAFQTFCIPTEGSGDADADAATHEATVPAQPRQTARQQAPVKPQQPKEAASTKQEMPPTTDAASVPAAPSRGRIADMIPEVPPTQHPVPGVGQFKGKAPVDPVQSGMTAQLLIGWLTKRTNELKRDANKAKAVSSAYENWKLEARAQWDELVDVDKRRVKQARESLEAALVAAKPAPVPAHDPSTGEILEAD